MYPFSYLEPVFCSMSSSNCCFLTCIQISQEAGQVVWYSHLSQNFPVYCYPHSQGFGIVNKAEIDVFLELSCFFHDPADVGNLICGSCAFSKTGLNIRKFTVHILLKPVWRILYSFCYVEVCSFYSCFLESFYHKWMLNFSKAFSASIVIIIWLLFFNLLMWCIALIDLQILKNPRIPGIKPTWS